jgi:hypothetical protein
MKTLTNFLQCPDSSVLPVASETTSPMSHPWVNYPVGKGVFPTPTLESDDGIKRPF